MKKNIFKFLLIMCLFLIYRNVSAVVLRGGLSGNLPHIYPPTNTGGSYSCKKDYCLSGYAGTKVSLVSIEEDGSLDLLGETYHVVGNVEQVLLNTNLFYGDPDYEKMRLNHNLIEPYNIYGNNYFIGTISGKTYDLTPKEVSKYLFHEYYKWDLDRYNNYYFASRWGSDKYTYDAGYASEHYLTGEMENVISNINSLIKDLIDKNSLIGKYIPNIDISKDKFTLEEIKLINKLTIIFEPFYTFKTNISNNNYDYITASIKGFAGLLYNSGYAKEEDAIDFDLIKLSTVAFFNQNGNYGILNKHSLGFTALEEITDFRDLTEYISSAYSGYGYNVIKFSEIFFPEDTDPCESPNPPDTCPGPSEETDPCESPNPSDTCPGVCDLDIKNTVPEDCGEDGTKTSGNIEEPSICALITSAKNKSNYNIKEYYTNVITRLSDNKEISEKLYATTYCQDKGQYNFYGFEEVSSGRYFVYDVINDDTNYFATFKGEKKCLSVIDYDVWESVYDIALDNVRIQYNNYKKWEALASKKAEVTYKSGCSGSVCKNGSKTRCSADGGANYKWSASYYYVDENGIETLKDATYTSSGTSASCSNTSTCKECKDTIDEQGSKIQTCEDVCCKGNCRDGRDGDSGAAANNKQLALSAYETSIAVLKTLEEQLLSINYYTGHDEYNDIGGYSTMTENDKIKIEYNEDMNGLVSVGIISNTSNKEVKYSQSSNNINSLCEAITIENKETSCNKDPIVKEDSTTKIYKTNLKTKIGVTSIYLPINKYAFVTVNDEEKYYQNKEIYTEIFTGNLSNTKINDNYIKLESNSFPTELRSYKFKEEVTFTYKVYTQANNLINLEREATYTCYVNVKPSIIIDLPDPINTPPETGKKGIGLGYVYRSVDLLDLFPNSKDTSSPNYRKPGSNWWNELNGFIELKTDIEEMEVNKNVYAKTPQYTVVLTPTKVKEIKQYNRDAKLYTNNSLKCDITGNNQLLCQSKFLNSNIFKSDNNNYNDEIVYFKYNTSDSIRTIFARDDRNNFYYYRGVIE